MPRTKKLEVRRRKQRLCVQCGQPVALHQDEKRKGQPYPWCQKHLLRRRESDRARKARRRARH